MSGGPSPAGGRGRAASVRRLPLRPRRLAALATLLVALAACCPAPAGTIGTAAEGGEVRLAVRTAGGAPAEGGGRLGHLADGGVTWLEPEIGVTLPASASFVAVGVRTADGALRVREVVAGP